jgi:hypothetical protein
MLVVKCSLADPLIPSLSKAAAAALLPNAAAALTPQPQPGYSWPYGNMAAPAIPAAVPPVGDGAPGGPEVPALLPALPPLPGPTPSPLPVPPNLLATSLPDASAPLASGMAAQNTLPALPPPLVAAAPTKQE